MKPPCKDCKDRNGNCYAKCDKFAEFKKATEKENAARKYYMMMSSNWAFTKRTK